MGRDSSVLHNINTGSGDHPAFYPVATFGSFPGGKVAGALMSRLRMPGVIPLFSLMPSNRIAQLNTGRTLLSAR
jgi:hypothetical protein